jgi:hypothetical protein
MTDQVPSKERIEAIAAANRLLDCPFSDPDDDARIVARQYLREIERATYRELTHVVAVIQDELNAKPGDGAPPLAERIATALGAADLFWRSGE